MNAGELKRNFELKVSTFLEEIKRDYRFDQRITDGIYHAVSDGGKRLRPVLYLTAFCDALNLSGSDFEREQSEAYSLALGIELIHSYSLVHDDMAIMDNDPMRRGKPSVHALFGEDGALLIGDV